MKKLIYKSLILLIIFGSMSCDVTDLQPFDSISESLAFTTPEKIELSMAGVYDAAQSGFYNGDEGNDRGYIFGAAHVQQNDMRGEDMLLINTFYGFTYQGTYTATTANNVNYWENGFRVINLANLFIEGVNRAEAGGVIDEATRKSYEGEARLLRAMTYHELVIMFARPYADVAERTKDFGGLPLHRNGVNGGATVPAAAAIGRSTIAQTYEFILNDLDTAELYMPNTHPNFPVVRGGKGAAIALKTRVKLHQEDWDGVITESNKLVSATAPFTSPIGGYALTASVVGPWADNESTDNIFSMNMNENDNLNVNAALANMLGSGAAAFGARGEVAISPILWNQSFWHPDDLRRTLLVETGASGRLFTNKYRDYTTFTDYSPLIRYAEGNT